MTGLVMAACVVVIIGCLIGLFFTSDGSEVEAAFAEAAATPICIHADAVEVDTLATALGPSERVAWWCPACSTQLDVTFEPPRRSSKVEAPPPDWMREETPRRITAGTISATQIISHGVVFGAGFPEGMEE